MAPAPSPPADEHGRAQARLSFVLLLIGPAVLLVGSALVLGGLFLPWFHYDTPYLVGGRYSALQPFVPMRSFIAEDLEWFVLAAIPIMATLVCLRIDATPRLRRQGLIRGSAIFFGLLTLVAGGVGTISLILSWYFLTLAAGNILMDSGYGVSLAGYILLMPGAILLMVGQSHVRQVVRLGRWRAQ
jgi:hypothetical protein